MTCDIHMTCRDSRLRSERDKQRQALEQEFPSKPTQQQQQQARHPYTQSSSSSSSMQLYSTSDDINRVAAKVHQLIHQQQMQTQQQTQPRSNIYSILVAATVATASGSYDPTNTKSSCGASATVRAVVNEPSSYGAMSPAAATTAINVPCYVDQCSSSRGVSSSSAQPALPVTGEVQAAVGTESVASLTLSQCTQQAGSTAVTMYCCPHCHATTASPAVEQNHPTHTPVHTPLATTPSAVYVSTADPHTATRTQRTEDALQAAELRPYNAPSAAAPVAAEAVITNALPSSSPQHLRERRVSSRQFSQQQQQFEDDIAIQQRKFQLEQLLCDISSQTTATATATHTGISAETDTDTETEPIVLTNAVSATAAGSADDSEERQPPTVTHEQPSTALYNQWKLQQLQLQYEDDHDPQTELQYHQLEQQHKQHQHRHHSLSPRKRYSLRNINNGVSYVVTAANNSGMSSKHILDGSDFFGSSDDDGEE